VENQSPAEDCLLQIYPNPTRDFAYIHFSVSEAGFCSLILFDQHGNKVTSLVSGLVQPGLYNAEVNTTTLPAGTYIVVLTTQNGASSKKLLVLR